MDDRVQQTHLLVQSTEQSAASTALDMARVLQRLQSLQVECQASAQMLAEQNARNMTLLQRDMQRLNETVRLTNTILEMVSRGEYRADVHSYPNSGCYWQTTQRSLIQYPFWQHETMFSHFTAFRILRLCLMKRTNGSIKADSLYSHSQPSLASMNPGRASVEKLLAPKIGVRYRSSTFAERSVIIITPGAHSMSLPVWTLKY